MAQWLRAYIILTEDVNLVPNTHVRWLTSPVVPTLEGCNTSCTIWHLYLYNTLHTDTRIHTTENNKAFLKKDHMYQIPKIYLFPY